MLRVESWNNKAPRGVNGTPRRDAGVRGLSLLYSSVSRSIPAPKSRPSALQSSPLFPKGKTADHSHAFLLRRLTQADATPVPGKVPGTDGTQ